MHPIIRAERQEVVHGVPGRFEAVTVGGRNHRPGTFTGQRWHSERRPIDGYGQGATLQVVLGFDDDCRNGHNTFTATAEVRRPGARDLEACGMMHEAIEEIFPELAPLLKWHLVSTDGPLHYVANTVYHAGDRDHNGRREGEPSAWVHGVRFGSNPILHKLTNKFADFLEAAVRFDLEVVGIDHTDRATFGTKYTFGGFASTWHECPFNSEGEALDFLAALQTCDPSFLSTPTAWSKGKARNLDAARSSAVWPDATDEVLSQEPDQLREALTERLPQLVEEFRRDMEAAGFLWKPSGA